ncbi:alkaline phosphatase family protein [Actinomadura rupiterrae]|uniref:alkaline phosphatase family protein n=1 Tax=Actinomadura rupiterrae TaxID=559627 RepID=UPI0020A2C0E0|nr:alkaline phosphatase family protein [Actinomadura rupiterrae]MCP2336678.1 acid phosphatase [Actinomadura rupiterrae]
MRPTRLAALTLAAAATAAAATAVVANQGSASPRAAVPAAAVAPAPAPASARGAAPAAVHRPDHVIVVMFENKNYSSVNGSSSAPYLNSLSKAGTLSTNSFGLTHPSQPNYIGLFSGSQHGVTGDTCTNLTGDNLGQQLISAGLSFKGYSESLPSAGYTGCTSGNYARKHAPWASFPTVSGASYNVPFSSFPTDYTKLPTLSFVIPNMCDDMHDCSIKTGDTWLKNHLDGYVQWARTHNSLLVATFDEDNFTSVNQIYTSFGGQYVKPGYASGTQIDHYTLLRTLEDLYGLPALGSAASRTPLTDFWTAG